MPRPDNAIFRLGRALARLSEYETPVNLTRETRQFFLTLAKTESGAMAEYYRNIASDDSVLVQRANAALRNDPLLNALIRTTIAPVIVSGGFRNNVIPGSAEATLNARLIPGAEPAAIAAELRRVIGDSLVEVSVPQSAPATAVSPDTTELYRALVREARRQYPSAEVTSYLFQAVTDARAWRSRGVPVYGIYPYAIDADDLTRMHGNDERVSVQSLEDGTEMIYRVLLSVAGKR